MSDYKSRAFEEHSDLQKRIQRLKNFICGDDYDSLPEIDRKDLKEQLRHMEGYVAALGRRVSRMCNSA